MLISQNITAAGGARSLWCLQTYSSDCAANGVSVSATDGCRAQDPGGPSYQCAEWTYVQYSRTCCQQVKS